MVISAWYISRATLKKIEAPSLFPVVPLPRDWAGRWVVKISFLVKWTFLLGWNCKEDWDPFPCCSPFLKRDWSGGNIFPRIYLFSKPIAQRVGKYSLWISFFAKKQGGVIKFIRQLNIFHSILNKAIKQGKNTATWSVEESVYWKHYLHMQEE